MKVLIVDDEPDTLGLLATLFDHPSYELFTAMNAAQARAIVAEFRKPYIAILDWNLRDSDMDGIELCRWIRVHSAPFAHIIILTSNTAVESAVFALEKGGADDFIRKPVGISDELRVKVAAAWKNLQEKQKLLNDASTDPLTGVLNRGAILERLRAEMARSRRGLHPLGILLIDLDHFKSINDNEGHLTGDRVLKKVVERMQHSVRPSDDLGRYGGEEFIGIVSGCDEESALALAERVREGVARDPILIEAHKRLRVTVSIGVAILRPVDSFSAEEFLRRADRALYDAKEAGRNKVHLFITDAMAP